MTEELTVNTDNLPMNGNLMQPATPAELTAQVQVIQKCLRTLMKPGTHYGTVPGCGDKSVLLKPGAEMILTLFRISAEPEVDESTDGFDVTYRVKVKGVHIPTGNIVGYGLGEASTSEKKYKWRKAVCEEEFNDTLDTRRQIAYIKKSGEVYKEMQVRQNPADITNTVLKMAKKRALVDLCLTATACSDIFVQDLDEEDINNIVNPQPQQENRYRAPQRKPVQAQPQTYTPPQQTAPSGNIISEAQQKRLYAIGKGKGLSNDEMKFLTFEVAGVNSSREITRDLYDDVVAAFETSVPGNVLPPEEGGL